MDILLQSDGQLYPSPAALKPRSPEKPVPPPTPSPPPIPPKIESRSFDELLLLGIAYLVFSSKKPDLPLLFALLYILLGPQLGGLFNPSQDRA